jgi:SAM-dependent methyltransferase
MGIVLVNSGVSMRDVAKAIARQIPSINALLQQRDMLLKERDALLRERDVLLNENAALRRENACQISSVDALTRHHEMLIEENTALKQRRKHFVRDYQAHVRHLIASHPIDEAMSLAVGGKYDEVGCTEVEILRGAGIKGTHSLIDLGCGSGRLAKHIGRAFPQLDYLGIDVVPELLAYSATQSPSHFRFVEHHELSIPAPDQSADFFAAFSVFTHLFHEESYAYLQDARRVLRPGGTIVFSFLTSEHNWKIFEDMLDAVRAGHDAPLVMFNERQQIEAWAAHLDLDIASFHFGPPDGQSMVILRKPAPLEDNATQIRNATMAVGGGETVNPPGARADHLLASVDRAARIVEIGPSFNPIAPKAGGWKTTTVDHASREELVEKYTGHRGVDISRIEEVDYVWRDGPLAAAVPHHLHGAFGVLIASHVIEHTTDFIDFLDAAEILLTSSGVVILAIPDKRYCFDYFRPLTTTGQVLYANALHRSRHTRRIVFDHVAYVVENAGSGAWGQSPIEKLQFLHTLDEAHRQFLTASEEPHDSYIDVHAWQFTPASFELLLLELARLGKTDWQIQRITPAASCEFYVWLCRGGKATAAALSQSEVNVRRLTLLKQSLLETREQVDFLLAGNPSLNNQQTHVA